VLKLTLSSAVTKDSSEVRACLAASPWILSTPQDLPPFPQRLAQE
jgi:hypothetical protein